MIDFDAAFLQHKSSPFLVRYIVFFREMYRGYLFDSSVVPNFFVTVGYLPRRLRAHRTAPS